MILRIRDTAGKIQEILAIKGNKGDKGDKGDTGSAGAAGATPVKGTDYFTDDDKTEMVNSVIAVLSKETWTFTLEDGSEVTKTVVLG